MNDRSAVMTNRVTPYQRLMVQFKEYARQVTWPKRVTMWGYPNSSQWVAAKASANLCASRIRALAPNQPSRPGAEE